MISFISGNVIPFVGKYNFLSRMYDFSKENMISLLEYIISLKLLVKDERRKYDFVRLNYNSPLRASIPTYSMMCENIF
jgi:hypothetical protein